MTEYVITIDALYTVEADDEEGALAKASDELDIPEEDLKVMEELD